MSTRLVLDMLAERDRLNSLATGYRVAGESDLKTRAIRAAFFIAEAVCAIEDFDAAQGEARERDREA